MKELFHYAIQDPKKWVYDKKGDCVKYNFSNYELKYNSDQELIFLDKSDQFEKSTTLYIKHPITSYPFILGFWKNVDIEMTPILFLLFVVISGILFLLLSGLVAGVLAIINQFGVEIPIESNMFIYASIIYPIIYILYTSCWYFFNKKIRKTLNILDSMRDSEKKIEYEKKIEKENEDFNKLVEEHFKKQSRKAKLEKIIKNEKSEN